MIINSEINNKFSYLILYLQGNFEFDSSEKLEQRIITEIDKHSIFDIIINFKDIKYINSYSLKEFVRLYSSMLNKGVKFYITEPSENARNVFRTTSLHLIIPIYSNNKEVFKEKR